MNILIYSLNNSISYVNLDYFLFLAKFKIMLKPINNSTRSNDVFAAHSNFHTQNNYDTNADMFKPLFLCNI